MSWATKIVAVLFIAYIAQSLHVFYDIFHYKQCNKQLDAQNCIDPFINPSREDGHPPTVQLRVYVNDRKHPEWTHLQRLFTKTDVDLSKPFDETIEITIPNSARKNGTMQAYVFLMDQEYTGDDLDEADWLVKGTIPLTIYHVPKPATFNLVSNATTHSNTTTKPVTHLRAILPINVMTESLVLDQRNVPDEIRHKVYLISNAADSKRRSYLPLMDFDDFRMREKDLVEITNDTQALNLTISFLPISWGRLRLSATMKMSFQQFVSLGFSSKDIDDMKSVFAETNFYFLALTVVVATMHMIFDYLTFKNDIEFWKGRKTMVGISTRTLVWHCFSDIVVFFYLLDEHTSYLVLVPAGIAVLVEFWKLAKALKVSLEFDGWKPRMKYGQLTEKEQQTGAFDMEGTRYLSYLLIPLCIAGAIYNLIYVPHKSWFSWLVKCLANCIYAFGFLFMLPQLFLNYKLKSVAHLPWRAFMYKAFNTFIDDIFAFMITMPTAHRLACFRDDIVFFIYLYQRWLYPVDKKRVNEFGEAFEDVQVSEDKEKKE